MKPTITIAEFVSREAAEAHFTAHGGWMFFADSGESIWFDAAHFTATQVFAHRATHGLSGHMSSMSSNRTTTSLETTP